jgi:hypothetical protein
MTDNLSMYLNMYTPATDEEQRHYTEQLRVLFRELQAKGEDCLTEALLEEAAVVSSCLSQEWPKEVGRVLDTVRAYLAGHATLANLSIASDRLASRLTGTVAVGGVEEARWQYQWACANFVRVETDKDQPYFVAKALCACLFHWPDGYDEAEAQCRQLARLRAALENRLSDGNRLRVSLLAD